MNIDHMIAFNLVLFAAIISPGPAMLVAIRSTLASGRRAGIATGLGLATIAACWTTSALLGLSFVFTAFPWIYIATKILGALYLIWIAFHIWRDARNSIVSDVQPAKNAFRQGVLIQLFNPKSVLFAAAVLVVIFPPNMTLPEKMLIVGNHFLIEVLFYTLLAFGMSTSTVSTAYMNAKIYLDRFSSLVLGALGLKLLFESK